MNDNYSTEQKQIITVAPLSIKELQLRVKDTLT